MSNQDDKFVLGQSTLPDIHSLENAHWELYSVFDKSVLLNRTNRTFYVYHGDILYEKIGEIKNPIRFDVLKNSKEGIICVIQVYYEDPETGEGKILHIDENEVSTFLMQNYPFHLYQYNCRVMHLT